MSKKIPFKRFLNGATRFYTLEELVEILKQTARDRTVQRESVWLWIKDKCHCYMSNVAVGYGKTALLHLIELEPTIKYLKDNCNNSEQEFKYIQHLENGNNDFIHTTLYGNPDVGKTEIVRIMGKIYS